MAFSLDGSGGTGIATHGATSVAASLTTSSGPDNVLIAFVHVADPTTARTVSSVSDSGSLTWARRAQFLSTNNGAAGDGAKQCIELWWAREPTALAARSVTANFSGAADVASMHVFAVHGANDPTAPWDPNGALPGTSANITSTPNATDIPGVATTNGNTFGMAFYASSRPAVPSGTDTGVTTLLTTSNNNGPGTYWSYTKSEYIEYTVAKSTFTFHMLGNTADWVAMFDALSGSRLANLAVTLDNVTLSATGGPTTAGSLAVTLDDVTLSATGDVTTTASASSGIALLLGL